MNSFRRLAVVVVLFSLGCGSALYGQQALASPRAINLSDLFALRDFCSAAVLMCVLDCVEQTFSRELPVHCL